MFVSEATNFEPHRNPSCFDLVVTDQPNIISEYLLYHLRERDGILKEPTSGIKRSMTIFPWHQYLNVNTDPNWQVKAFTDNFLNIMSNFIPNETKRFVPRNPPWITKPLKTMFNRKNILFNNYKRHGYKAEDKVRLDAFRIECQQAVETAKLSYLTNLGNKVNNPGTSQKSYCKIINRVMNKSRAPKIPPLLVNNLFILNWLEKARYFNDYFSQQCKPVISNSVLPILGLLTNEKIDHVTIENDEIISLIRKINLNKATVSDGISGQMLLLCDESVILPLQIIFTNILSTFKYPDMWKLANVTTIFKKGNKQLIKNYRPISLLPICGKVLVERFSWKGSCGKVLAERFLWKSTYIQTIL